MPRRYERIERIRAVEREYEAATVAVELLREQLHVDPSSLEQYGLNPPDFTNLRENLSATYLIRIFAEFEAGIRDAWANAFRRRSHPTTGQLIDSIAARCYIEQDWLDAVHDVRECRNNYVHEGETEPKPMLISQARQFLCRFSSTLPLDW